MENLHVRHDGMAICWIIDALGVMAGLDPPAHDAAMGTWKLTIVAKRCG
jgi:hypothetical protein